MAKKEGQNLLHVNRTCRNWGRGDRCGDLDIHDGYWSSDKLRFDGIGISGGFDFMRGAALPSQGNFRSLGIGARHIHIVCERVVRMEIGR